MQTYGENRRPLFCLIVGTDEEVGEPRPLTVDVPGRGRALAVFSFQEEARLYLQLGGPKGRWAIVEATPDEVIWVLLGPLRGIMWVVLDPMAGGCAREAIGLVTMSREGFLDLLSGQASPRRPLVNVGVGTGSGIVCERRQRG